MVRFICIKKSRKKKLKFLLDGTDLATPRVFKIHPNTTYVGRDAKAGVGKQYFYVNIRKALCSGKELKGYLDRRSWN